MCFCACCHSWCFGVIRCGFGYWCLFWSVGSVYVDPVVVPAQLVLVVVRIVIAVVVIVVGFRLVS